MSANAASSVNGFLKDYEPLIDNAAFTESQPLFRTQEQQLWKRNWLSCCTLSNIATIVFAFVSVTGQVTQYVCLPLWIDSTSVTTSENQTAWKPTLDSYFVVSFAALSFVIVFGLIILFCDLIFPKYLAATDWNYRRLLLLLGFIQGLSALFIVFSSSGDRTPPYLQAILGNFSIPITLLFRFLFLKKIPTKRKFLTAAVVVMGLFICLIPTIFPRIDPQASTNHDLGGATGPGRILWPLAFMFGFGITAISYIVEEKAVKMGGNSSHSQASLLCVLFWTSLSQFLAVVLLFWADIIPGFGHTNNVHEFIQNWAFGFQCVFGGAGCSWGPGGLGFLFITAYIMTVGGSALLLRYSEGATLLAIVMSLCTPMGFVFWMLFQEKPFHWNPTFHKSSWFSVIALLVMIPAAFIYNTGMPEGERQREEITPTNP